MRTLKKTLCLVLCLAMMAGLCVFASADFNDQDKIENEEAVAVLTGIGVINGDDKGNFNPEGTLTRAEAATIITKVLDAADIKVTTDKFTDVTADFWGMPYIAYCVAEGVVAGYGDGTFGPNDKLTGYQWATMLLRALGYEIAGETWQIDVAKLVKETKMAAGITFDGTKDITRDDAAQMAFNAIKYSVKEETNEYIVTDKTTKKVIYQGTDALTALVLKQSNANYELTYGTTREGSIGYENFGLKETSKTDAFGRSSKIYTNGLEKDDKDYVEYAVFAPVALETYYGSVKISKLAADLGYSKVSDKFTIKVFTDSETGASYTDLNKTSKITPAGGSETDTITGTVIEVYKAGADSYEIVVVNTYAKKLVDGDVKKATKATASADATPAYIVVEGSNTSVKYNDNGAFVTDGYKVGDVILYTKADGAIQTVEEAIAVTGAVSKKTNTTATIDGVTYTFAGGFALPTVTAPNTIFNTTFTYYVDELNNVYMSGAVGEAQITIDGFVYVLGYQIAKDGKDGDLFNEAEETTVAVKAQVLTTSGKTEVVDLKVFTEGQGAATKYFYNSTVDGSKVDIGTVAAADYKKLGAAYNPNWMAYTVEDGVYTLTTVDKGNAVVKTLANDFDKGDKAVTFTGNGSAYMTSNTVYTYTNTVDKVTKTVNGYKDIEIASGTTVLVVYADANKTTVSKLYSVKDTTDKTGTTAHYAYAVEEGAEVASGTEWTFYIDGKEEVKSVKLTAEGEYTATSLSAKKVYDLRIDENGVVTGAKEIATVGAGVTVTAVEETYVVTSNGAVDLNTKLLKVYNITADGEGAADTIEVDDVIFVAVNGNDGAELIYIVG